jgi:type I restriction enzyme S subunit
MGTGATVQGVKVDTIANLRIALPPLDEQKRIVAKLDLARSQVDRLTSNLDSQIGAVGDLGRAAVNEQIKQGQLPEGDLRSSDLDISSTADRVTGGWPIVPISSVCRVDWGNTKLTKKSYVEDGKFLAVSAAGGDGRIGHAEHAANTPVLSAIGANCGRMFLPTEDFTAIKNTITLTPALGVTTGDFLFHLMQSIQLPIRGAGQPFISKGDIQEFEVSLPPLDEQKRIVAKLDEVQQELAALRGTLDKRRSLALSFRERTLAAAFASDL